MFRQVQVTQHTCSAWWKSFQAQQFKYRKSLTQKLFTTNLLEQYLQQHLPILHTGNMIYIVETQKPQLQNGAINSNSITIKSVTIKF